MTCDGDPATLNDSIVAERAARLAAVAEAASERAGTEPPLSLSEARCRFRAAPRSASSEIEITRPEAAPATVEAHRGAFASAGIARAFGPVIELVIQPGVEFYHRQVVDYEQAKARSLRKVLDAESTIVFEPHSIDYQSPEALASLVSDGFAILKVGPALTFAMREVLYGLDHIAREREPTWTVIAPEMGYGTDHSR